MKTRHWIGLIPLFFGVWLFGGLAPYGIHVGEDGDLLYQMFATYQGEMPYVDFSTGYTPGYFYWHAFLFQLFGVDALVTRVAVAVANTITLYLLYALSARLMRPTLALITPLVFVGSLLAFPGDFVTFNVPYPAWYNIVFWLGSLSATLAYVDRGRYGWLALAGVLAGLSFSMKPNIGLFNIAALSFFVLWWNAPAREAGKLTRWCWWILAVATAAGIVGVFWARLGDRSFTLFPLPLLVLAAVLVTTAQWGRGRSGFMPAAAFLLGGFAVTTVPWLAYFLVRLGPQVFASDVLLIGSAYELFFHIPHRFLWNRWDQGIVLIALGLALVPLAVRRRWIAWWIPFAGAAAVGLLVLLYVARAPMTEGFQAAVASRVQDLAFFLFQFVEWLGIAVIAVALVRQPRRRSRFLAALVLVALSATALSLGMYPRSDFMHLMISAPGVMILGTVLLARLIRRWQMAYAFSPFWSRMAVVMLVAPVVLTASVMATKTVALSARVYSHYLGIAAAPLVHMDLPRASLVMEPGGEWRFSALRDAARYIERHTRPDEYVLPFPNLNLLCFLSGRLNPARKGYFHPGYPDHPTEAEIVTGLRQRIPKLVVSLHGHELFLTTAPLYYFLLRDFVQRRFDFRERIGPYDILFRREGRALTADSRVASEDATAPVDPSLLQALDAPNSDAQLAAMFGIRVSRDPRAAAVLAQKAVDSQAPHRLLMLRIVAEFGDERSVPALVSITKRGLNTDAGQQAASSLFFIVGRSMLESYWFTPDAARARLDAVRGQLDRDTFRAWLRNRRVDGRLRYVAAWGAGVLGDQGSVPYLLKLQEDDQHLNLVATFALTKLGRARESVETLISGLDEDDTYLPNYLIELYRQDPEAVRPAILDGLTGGTEKQREVLAYVSAVLRDCRITAALSELREDSSLRVQLAAAWALQNLAGEPLGECSQRSGTGSERDEGESMDPQPEGALLE